MTVKDKELELRLWQALAAANISTLSMITNAASTGVRCYGEIQQARARQVEATHRCMQRPIR